MLRQTLATWGWALSCCKINRRCCTQGTSLSRDCNDLMTSSLYLTAVKLPVIIISCDFTSWEMIPHTITEPPKLFPFWQSKFRRSVLHDVGKCNIDHLVKKSEMWPVSKKDLSPMPHRKSVPSPTPYMYNACDVPESGRTEIRTVEKEPHSAPGEWAIMSANE